MKILSQLTLFAWAVLMIGMAQANPEINAPAEKYHFPWDETDGDSESHLIRACRGHIREFNENNNADGFVRCMSFSPVATLIAGKEDNPPVHRVIANIAKDVGYYTISEHNDNPNLECELVDSNGDAYISNYWEATIQYLGQRSRGIKLYDAWEETIDCRNGVRQ